MSREGVERLVVVACLTAIALVMPARAFAVNPETTVGGAGSKWFAGSVLQQEGENCSVLGGSYSEVMVSAIAGYGGAPGGQIAKIGDRYYAELLISIPGNPCGPGSAFVGTDLVLPRGTSVDTSAAVRCFVQTKTMSTFGEISGGAWSFTFANGSKSTGQYCSAQVGPSLSGSAGAVGVSFRPLASGTLFELFVPITSTQTLQGAGSNPVDEIKWILITSGTYLNLGSTSVWANVLPSAGATPYIYFARNPSVVPFWNAAAPLGQQNQAEWFANLYSAGLPGTLCWDLFSGPTAGVGSPTNCSTDASWNGTVTAGSDTWQVNGPGPNGGFVPFGYDTSSVYTIRWTFSYNQAGMHTVFKDISFTSLAGPDADGDGVPDLSDACPNVKGTQSNGCPLPVENDPDGDGIFGTADKCPTVDGSGTLDGCPASTAMTPSTLAPTATITPAASTAPIPPPAAPIKIRPASAALIQAPLLRAGKASASRKAGSVIVATGLSVSCPSGGSACPVSLVPMISADQWRAAKSKKKPTKPLVTGRVQISVAAGRTATVGFRLSSKAAALLRIHRKLRITLTGAASTGAGGPKTIITKAITITNPKVKRKR